MAYTRLKVNKKRRLYGKFKYKAYRNKLNHLIKIAKKQYYNEKLEAVKTNIKATWKLLKVLMNKSKPSLNYPASFIHNK